MTSLTSKDEGSSFLKTPLLIVTCAPPEPPLSSFKPVCGVPPFAPHMTAQSNLGAALSQEFVQLVTKLPYQLLPTSPYQPWNQFWLDASKIRPVDAAGSWNRASAQKVNVDASVPKVSRVVDEPRRAGTGSFCAPFATSLKRLPVPVMTESMPPGTALAQRDTAASTNTSGCFHQSFGKIKSPAQVVKSEGACLQRVGGGGEYRILS